MGRQRQADTGLPSAVYFKHGAYYLVTRGKWYRLCADRKDVEKQLQRIPERRALGKQQLRDYAMRRLFVQTRNNAKGRRKIEFALTREDVVDLLELARWRCAVTKVPFTLEVINGKKPYAPSIDRIDSSAGYSRENCRVVCVAANYAMNVWGDSVLRRLLRVANQ